MSRLYIRRGEKHRLGLGRLGMPARKWASTSSFWHRKLANDHPIVNDGNNYAAKMAAQLGYTTTSSPRTGYYDPPYSISVAASSYSIPIWVAPADYPKRTVFMRRTETRKATGTLTNGSNQITSVVTSSGFPAFAVGDQIWSNGGWGRDTPSPSQPACLEDGTTVTAVGSGTLTLSKPAIADGTAQSLFGNVGNNSFLNTLQAEMLQVPVPLLSDMPSGWGFTRLEAAGTDKACAIYDEQTDIMYEFWLFDGNEQIGYWYNYGGAIHNFSQTNGTIPNTWGLRASSIAASCGVMQVQEFRDGEFPHKLVIAMPVTANSHLAPATRHDNMSLIPSGSFADAVPEGGMYRFPADIAINPSWTREVKMIVKAIRDYGLVHVDTGGTAQFWFEDPKTTGTMFSRTAKVQSGELNPILPPGINLSVVPWNLLQQIAYIP